MIDPIEEILATEKEIDDIDSEDVEDVAEDEDALEASEDNVEDLSREADITGEVEELNLKNQHNVEVE